MLKLRKLSLLLMLCTISVMALIGLTACSGKKKGNEPTEPPKAVAVESIKFDGNTITWDEVSGATSYKIQCAGKTASVYTNKYSITIGSSTNEVTFEVSAKNSLGESEIVGKTFTRIKSINAEDMTFAEDGTLSWAPVENATGYIVEVNGKVAQEGVETVFSDFEFGKKNTIRIRPLGGDGYFSSFGTSATKTYLGAPTNIKYDGEEISWTGTPLASSYTLYIDGNLYERELKGTKYAFAPTSNTLTIALKCEGDGKNTFSSAISEEITCSKLQDVSNITVVEGKIVWDAVEGATSYKVKLNGVEKTVQKCELDNISSGQNHTVSVKPVSDSSDYYFSNWCSNVNVYILSAPVLKWNAGLSLDGAEQNSLYWDNTNEADSYRVKVLTPSGKEESYDATTIAPHLSYAYLETGTYDVSVCAVSANAGKFDSQYSTPLKVTRLASPKLLANGAIESTANNYDKGFKVKFNTVNYANGYSLYKEDNLLSSVQATASSFDVTNVLNENQNAGGKVNYRIVATGNNTLSGGVVKLNSLTSNATEFAITVLPTPSGVRMEGSSVAWDVIANADVTGYAVKTESSLFNTNNSSYRLQSISAGEHDVAVCSAGNGAEILPSPYSTSLKIRKLSAPNNIKVDTTTDEGRLTWSAPAGAQGCVIYFNGSSEGIDATNLKNINEYMRTGTDGVSLVMVATANYFNQAENLYVIESDMSQTKQFTKIDAISSAKARIDGYNLKWDSPNNITDIASSKITYRIYNDQGQLYSTVDRPEISLENVAGGRYTFTIRCVGDGEEFFNSELSNAIDITKLQNVTLDVNDLKNGYKWIGVPQASKYTVKVGSKTVADVKADATKDTYELLFDKFGAEFVSAGSYQVSIVSVGNPSEMVMDSSPTLRTQDVKQLSAPEISATYSHERVDNSGQIIVTSVPVANANGYSYSFSGLVAGTVENGETVCRYNAGNPGDYHITARAKGGLFDDNGVCYITSLNSDTFTFTLLSAPSSNYIEIDASNLLTWRSIPRASGYTIKLEYNDGLTETITNESSMYQIAKGKRVVKVQICANGNGRTTISSKFEERIYY